MPPIRIYLSACSWIKRNSKSSIGGNIGNYLLAVAPDVCLEPSSGLPGLLAFLAFLACLNDLISQVSLEEASCRIRDQLEDVFSRKL